MTIIGSATVFHNSDMERALRFYKEVLGFTEAFRYEGEYVGVEHGEVQIHLSADTSHLPAGKGQIYIFCDDVDAYYADITAKGAVVPVAPQNYPYGMRDFYVTDPDGNRLAFGMAI